MSKSETYPYPPATTTATYHTHHDWTTTEPLSTTVVNAIAEVMDADPTEIGPLYEQFDPDALDGLFSPRRGELCGSGGHVGFTFDGHHVFIQSDGHISVHPPGDVDDASDGT
jgi:hypothetical protein